MIHLKASSDTREAFCATSIIGSEEESIALEDRCPVACGNPICYDYFNGCSDGDSKEVFQAMTMDKTCQIMNFHRTENNGMPNKWYEPLCQNFALAMDTNGNFQEASEFNIELVQDRCPVACHNLECTCADKELTFVTPPIMDTTTGLEIEGLKERTCESLHVYDALYRNTVCVAETHAVTPDPTYVYILCPKACGFRPECFCKDSKGPVNTPGRTQEVRACMDASIYSDTALEFFCDEKLNPEFARSCPVICGNTYCIEEFLGSADSTDTLSIYAGRLATSCSIISASDPLYQEYACGLNEDDLQVPIATLCPKACGFGDSSDSSDEFGDSSDSSETVGARFYRCFEGWQRQQVLRR